MNADSLAVVVYQLTIRVLEIEGLGGILGDEHHIKLTVLQHTVELALASSEGDGSRGIVIGDIDGGILALLVVVVGAFAI